MIKNPVRQNSLAKEMPSDTDFLFISSSESSLWTNWITSFAIFDTLTLWEMVYSKVVKHGKNAWKFMFLLKIYNFILTAPDCMFFITLLLHLKINVVTWNNMNKNNIPSQLTFTCSKSTIETLVFSHLFLVFLLLTLIK